MQKKFLSILMVSVVLIGMLGLTGCVTRLPRLGRSRAAVEPMEIDPNNLIVGVWNWNGSPYYVFNADGTGRMQRSNINWTTNNGVLSVCSTPRMCRNNCSQPTRWDYVVDEGYLHITGRQLGIMNFTYTRHR